MRQVTKADIERVLGAYVQPLFSGVISAVSGMIATLTGVTPFGGGNVNFRMAFPFGFVSAPVKGVMAYLLNLGGSALAPIILSHLDKMRPTPSAPGETQIYSLASDGSSVKIQVVLTNDGGIKILADGVDLLVVLNRMATFLENARTLTAAGPQPLFDVTGADTTSSIQSALNGFVRS